MKKLILLMVFGLISFGTFAQDGGSFEPDSLFTTFVTLVAGIPFIVEAVKGVFNPKDRLLTQLISWGTGIAVTMFGWWFGIGFLHGLLWWNALIIGVFASLAANGVYDTNFYTWLLKTLGILKK